MAISTRSVRQFGIFQNQLENRGADMNGDTIAAARASFHLQAAKALSGSGGELVSDLSSSGGGGPLHAGALVLTRNQVQIISVSTEDTIPGGAVANDGITFILLTAVANGAQIFFTDRNWNGTVFAGAGGGEGTFTYTASGDQAAGTVIHISQAQLTTAGMALSDAGETIYAYQGAINAPTVFLHAVDIADGNTGFEGNELLNTGLVNGVSAVAINEDNAEFGTRTHNIQIADLIAQINNNTDWVRNDNSPQDGSATGTPAFTAPDAQIWVASSGAGEGITTINLDGTYSSGTLGYQIVQAFQNDANLFHPSDITLDTVHDKYFFVDSDISGGHNRIIQGSISQLLNNPGQALTFTVLYSNSIGGADPSGSMRTLSVDTAHGIIYFDIGTTFNKIVYNTANQTPTVLANLNSFGTNNYITQVSIDYATGQVLLGSSRVTSFGSFDAVSKNYVYSATGLTSSSSTLTFSRINFNPDDNDPAAPNNPNIPGLSGEAFPAELGTIRGIDIDPVTHIAYIVTGSVLMDTSVLQDGSAVQLFRGGIYSYDLNTGTNPNGNFTQLFLQDGTNGPVGLMYYIEVDHATGRYYVIDETGTNANPGDGGVWSGLLAGGTPDFVATVGNFNGLGPQGLEIQHASTLTGTDLAASYTETPGNPSPNGTAVTVANAFNAHDADSEGDANQDELAGAQVRISGNFQSGAGHQDQLLTLSGGTNQNGTVLVGTDTVTFSYNAALGVMTFTGITTLDNYESLLARIQFRADGDNPTNYGTVADRVISFSTFDGLLYSDEVNATVTVTGVNDAPVNTVPSALAGTEDTAKIITGFSINDVDADPASQTMTVTLSVTNGTLTLLTNVAGGITAGQLANNGTGTVTINATQNQINATVAGSGLSYQAIADYNGADTLHIVTSDNGNNGTGGTLTDTDDVAITIAAVADIANDAVTVAEDSGANSLNGIGNPVSLLANDSFENATRFISAVTQGAHGSVTINDNGTAGDKTDDFVVYTVTDANFNGTDSFQYTVTSPAGVTETATVNVTLTAVNDPVTGAAPATLTLAEDATNVAVAGLSISDIDAALAPAGVYEVTLSSTNGTMTLTTLTGLTFTAGDGSADATMTFHGTLAAINTALATASYTPTANYNGPATITLAVTDTFLGVVATGTGVATSDTDIVNVTVTAVNDAPVNTVPGTQTIGEDTTLTFTGGNAISVADIDANGADVTVTLTVLHGTLTVGGNAGLTSLTGDGTGTVVIVGSVAEVNNAMNGLFYAPTGNYNGTDTLQITTNDNGNTGTPGPLQDVDNVTININAANDPVTGTAPATLTLAEDATNVAVAGLSISDIDATLAPAGVYEVTLSSTNGTMTLSTLTGLVFSAGDGTADATMTFHGALAAINTALATASYTPTANYNGAATITLAVTDTFLGVVATGTGAATSDTDVVNVTVTAVSDPVTTNAPATLTLAEDATNVAIAGLSISDVDTALAPAGVYEVTLSATHGLLTLTTIAGLTFSGGSDGTADATMTFSGTLAAINTALATAKYTPDANYNGSAQITLQATDIFGGTVATGTGSATSDSDVVNVTVTAVNDTPVVAVQASVASTEQVFGALDPTATITDVELGALNNYAGSSLTVARLGGANAQDFVAIGTSGSFTIVGNVLLAGGQTFATFTGGSGTALIINFTGSGTPATQALVDAVVQSLQYRNNSDTPPASIQLVYTFNDGAPGNAGQGGGGSPVGTDTITVNITDTPENAPPVVDLNSTTPGTNETASYTEGGPVVLLGSAVSVTDADGDQITGATITITDPSNGDGLSVLGVLPPGITVSGASTATTLILVGTASAAFYQSAIDLISYSNASDDPTAGGGNPDRVITVTVSDAFGTGPAATMTVSITGINDEPTLAASGNNPTYAENGAAVDLYNSVATQIKELNETYTSLTLTVSGVADGASEILTIDGTNVALTNGNSVVTATNGLTVNVTVALGVATVSFSGAALFPAQLITLVDNLAYRNASENPTDGNRVVTITQLVDSGSNTPPNDNTATLSIVSTVNVDPVNDAPVNNVPVAQSTNEDISKVFSTGNANAITVGDVDATVLTVTLTVTHGTLTLAGTAGLSFGGGANGSATMTFTGTAAAINTAVNGLTYAPTANYNGPDSLQISTTDNGQAGAGGTLTDNDSVAIAVVSINDAPAGTDKAVTINEDAPYVFAIGDFGFTDPNDAPANALLSVKITTLPSNGTIFYDSDGPGGAAPVAVAAGQFILGSEIALGKLTFVPATNASGTPLSTFTFQVQDNGGTANTGVDLDQSANTFTINVSAQNDAPAFSGLDATPTYTENAAAVVLDGNATVFDVELAASGNYAGATLNVARNGGASALDTYSFVGGTINFIGASVAGTLTSTLGGIHTIASATRNGGTLAVTFNASATQADVNAVLQQLAYANSSENPSGPVVLNYTFTDGNSGVQGSGGLGTATGSVTVNIVPVNDAPAGADNTLTGSEDDPVVFTLADFGFTDPAEGNAFNAIRVMTFPAVGKLFLDVDGPGGAAPIDLSTVGPGVFVSAADIAAGHLYFLGALDGFGSPYASFTFQVQDNGGILNGGVDLDQSPNTMTINLTPDNLPPVVDLNGAGVGINYSTTFVEDGAAVAIGSGLTVAEQDLIPSGGSIVSAKVTLTDRVAGDSLAFSSPPPGGFSVSTTILAGSITLDITGTGTAAQYQAILQSIVYSTTNQDPTVGGTDLARTITVTVNDGGLDSAVATTTVNITAIDDLPVAQPDAFTITESGTITAGNLFANNGSGVDTDPDGPPLSISAVNGSALNVGSQITLASGAHLTVNANGTFDYDPNGVFLTTPTAGSGASNTPSHDSFTYSVAGGNTVTVSITLTGLDTDDLLLGTSGADVLIGGAGNDIYIVDNAGDRVIEDAGQGSDIVYALVSYVLTEGSSVETLSGIDWSLTSALNLTGNSFTNAIYGNAGANVLDGGGGADVLTGFGGNDIYIVDNAGDRVGEDAGQGSDIVYALVSYVLTEGSSVESLSAIDWSLTSALDLTGNSFNNAIYGNAGANVLDGGGGADVLTGFGGNDIYIVDNAGDRVGEDAGQGSDIVYALVSYVLTEGSYVESLSAIDWSQTSALDLTGNSFTNAIYGNAGNNVLDGGAGADVLTGFGGNDTYYVDGADDQVIEAVGGGNDTVFASTSYTLAAGQEIEFLLASNFSATTALNFTGNEFANTIYGNDGANVLDGKGGNDLLVGQGGADTFAFTTALGANNVDVLFGFTHGSDKIALDDAIFTGIGGIGTLNANAFVTGAAAGDLDDRIIYNNLTGQLLFDADGSGAGAAIQFATLSPGLTLTASDFLVI